jgi:hypothetical protein
LLFASCFLILASCFWLLDPCFLARFNTTGGPRLAEQGPLLFSLCFLVR